MIVMKMQQNNDEMFGVRDEIRVMMTMAMMLMMMVVMKNVRGRCTCEVLFSGL